MFLEPSAPQFLSRVTWTEVGLADVAGQVLPLVSLTGSLGGVMDQKFVICTRTWRQRTFSWFQSYGEGLIFDLLWILFPG